ncbi:MAG TPA: globin-coupled sensor protein [Rhizobium sp.]
MTSDIEKSLKDRLNFIDFDEGTCQTLREMQSTIRENVGPTLDSFYGKVMGVPKLKAFFRDKAHMNAAKGSQQKHWDRMAEGKIDVDYVRSVTGIGKAHARIGLEPQWYIGAYTHVVSGLIHAVLDKHWPFPFGRKHAKALADKIVAIVKTANIDMDYSISIYIEEVERSRQAVEMERQKLEADQRMALEHLRTGLASLANGDFDNPLRDNLPENFQEMVKDYNAALEGLRQSFARVRESSREILASTETIASAADDLAMRTAQQAAGVEESSTALQELSVSVSQTAANAEKAAQVVHDAQQEARNSSEVVNRTVSAMSEIERSSSEVYKITGVIDEIAFQTNLLALNAGVEAARAGDAGKGFAVVALEVRQLAQRSAEAAKEIKSLIELSSAQVREGVGLVSNTGLALTNMAERITSINSIVGDIASAARDQANGVGEVNIAIRNMDEITQQNAAMVEKTSGETTQLRTQVDDLVDMLRNFRTRSHERLERNVSQHGHQHRAVA